MFNDIRKYLSENEQLQNYSVFDNYIKEDDLLEKRITEYYSMAKNKLPPQLWIEIKKVNGISVILNIEVGETLYYGVIFADDKFEKIPIDKDVLSKAFGRNNFCWEDRVNKNKGKDWWIWWRYLPFKDSPLNFRRCSGIYASLYDKQGYQNILNAVTKEFGDNLESILKTGMPNSEQIL